LIGEIVITVDGIDHTVLTGQTLDFRGDRAHSYRNVTEAPARVVMVVTVPSGEYDRRTPRQR
jgi:quercetin dioxygenase-like cupin family protein